MPLLNSRLIRWHATKLVNSIEITSTEQEAGQQSFIAWEAEQSTQHERIISVTFHDNFCHLKFIATRSYGADSFFRSESFSGSWKEEGVE